jgi:tRNA 2-thiouridine synthesizing protein E
VTTVADARPEADDMRRPPAEGNEHGGGATSAHQRTVDVDGHAVPTDSEGYLERLDDWSEAFARALAREEGLALTPQHWELIRFLREHYQEHGVQAQVRVMIRHFARVWGPERGSNHALHDLFPRGGPQKQGNRLAGLLRTKGEH